MDFKLLMFIGVFITSSLAIDTVKLSSGYEMPLLGMGTANIFDEDAMGEAIASALEIGYRHFDSSHLYGNEKLLGKELRKHFDNGGKREDLFITTKLPPYGDRAEDVALYLNDTLNNLGFTYIDLYLIHKPFGFLREAHSLKPKLDKDGNYIMDYSTDILAIWKAMEDTVRAGKVRSIGISNFNESQIERILEISTIPPSALQVEIHEYHQSRSLRNFCWKNDIAVMGFSPLGSPAVRESVNPRINERTFPELLIHPTIHKIAQKYNKTNAQIMLRHFTQEGVTVIPKSTHPQRLKENSEIFDFVLEEEDLRKLRSLDRGIDGRIFNHFHDKGSGGHPEYPFKDELDRL